MIRELKGKKIKNLIKRIRTDYELTQDELAEKIYVSRQLVSNWEKNNTVPGKDTMNLICKELNISKKTLLFKYGYGRKKLIGHCLNVILFTIAGLLIVSLTIDNYDIEVYAGNIHDIKMKMTDTIFIKSKKRKTLYLGSVLKNNNALDKIRIYYSDNGNLINIYEGKYKNNLRLDELSNYSEYFRKDFDINNLFIDFSDTKNNVIGSYKFTFENIPYQDEFLSLFNKKAANLDQKEQSVSFLDTNKLIEKGYHLENGSSSIYVNGNYKYNKDNNTLIYYDKFLYIELNIDSLSGEVKRFIKKSLTYDYGFYYELKTGILICEFGNCTTKDDNIEIIKSEYEKITDANAN